MTVEQRNQEPSNQFPKGLCVLAVDDNPGCLRILDQLLKKCEYQVTTTTKAVTALNMLRENKDKFDLVITDVQMPDMDGFELLEQVGLEMDLPVIMLSAYDDHKLVMKGITHGACDYLLKPVRLEAVKTIWRHVIRKKDLHAMGQKNNSGSLPSGPGDGEQKSSDQTGKLNNKRKNEENDENDEEIEDSSTQKRPRVVWCKELHRKFLDAVEQLGIDKAVPKKIQQLMDVENLSRENVASHLQKFRMSIKKINEVSRQHENTASAYNNTNSSYFRLGSYNGVGTFNTLSGSHVQNQLFAPYSQKAMMGRLNSPAGLGICRPSSSSSGMVQLSHAQNNISDFGKFHQGNQNNSSIFQRMPLFEFNQLQNNKNAVEKLPVFLDTKVTMGNSGNSLVGAINNSLVPYTPFSETQHDLGFGIQSSALSCSNNWPNAVQSNSFVLNNHYNKQAPFSNMNNIPRLSQLGNNSFQDISSSRSDGAWNYQNQDILHYPNSVYGLVNNSPVAVDNACSLEQSLDSKIENFNRNDDSNVTVLNGPHMLLNEVGSTTALPTHGSHSCNSFGSLDDLLDDVLKQDQEEVSLIEGDFGCDIYSLGT